MRLARPRHCCFWGKADISQGTIPAESVENDPKRTGGDGGSV